MEVNMPNLLSTSGAAKLLGVPPYRLDNLIRLGKVDPALMLGRRAWQYEDIFTAAKLLGVDTPEVRNQMQLLKVPA